MKKVTMQDIADRLGITKVSVSKALNNQPGIGTELRGKILQTAKEMNYSRPSGSGFVLRKLNFTYICPKRYFLDDEYFYTKIYYYINRYCTEHDHNCDCLVISAQDEEDAKLPLQLTSRNYDGIFIGGEFSEGFLKEIEALQSEVVAIDFYKADLDFNYVVVENYFAGQKAARYLYERGHRDIGFIGDFKRTSSLADRFFGYLKFLRLHDLSSRPQAVFSVLDESDSQPLKTIELPDPLPSAFICHCDKAAFVLIQQLREQGYCVPDDVSLISFDNTRLSEMAVPRLTTVDIDRKELSRLAIEVALERLENPQGEKLFRSIKTKIIERDSVRDVL